MKEIYYKGKAYQYRVIDLKEKRLYQLYESGVLKHSIEESELDVKSIVSLVLDAYYTSVKAAAKPTLST